MITLSHTPEVVTIPVSAQWNDTENQDGKRPASVEITLAANGKESKKVALTAENNWKASFDNLDVYAAGKAITYTVTAADVEGYTASAAGDNAGFVVSFNHETEKTSVSMTTVWDDKNNQDGYRPGDSRPVRHNSHREGASPFRQPCQSRSHGMPPHTLHIRYIFLHLSE